MLNRMLKTTTLLLFLLALGLPALQTAQAQLKVGYADNQALLANMPKYRQTQQQWQQEYQGAQAQLQTKAQSFQEKLEKYQKQQPLLNDSTRAQREQELAQLQSEIQQGAAQEEQKLAAREVELMRPLLEEMQNAIDAVAQEQGLDLVLSTQTGLLYANEDKIVNITPAVATRLGIEVQEDPTASTN